LQIELTHFGEIFEEYELTIYKKTALSRWLYKNHPIELLVII
jgi:hypothetical protein